MTADDGLPDRIRLELGSLPDVRLFRNTVGGSPTPYGYVTYGLGTGTSDLIGWRTVTVTPEAVGSSIAIFTAIECKRIGARTDRKRLENQMAFINVVRRSGGLAGMVTSVADARSILLL